MATTDLRCQNPAHDHNLVHAEDCLPEPGARDPKSEEFVLEATLAIVGFGEKKVHGPHLLRQVARALRAQFGNKVNLYWEGFYIGSEETEGGHAESEMATQEPRVDPSKVQRLGQRTEVPVLPSPPTQPGT